MYARIISSLATQHRHEPLRGSPGLCVDASLRVAPGWDAFLPHRAVLPGYIYNVDMKQTDMFMRYCAHMLHSATCMC